MDWFRKCLHLFSKDKNMLINYKLFFNFLSPNSNFKGDMKVDPGSFKL